MKVIRWPELDILESNLKKIDKFWYQTNEGPINIGVIFPVSQLDKLKELKARIDAKKEELSNIECEIYRVSRDFLK